MLILGIDPGLQGAYALYDHARPATAQVFSLPVTADSDHLSIDAPALALQLAGLRAKYPGAVAVVERVHGMPRQAGVFNFGLGAGIVHGILAANSIPYALISPQQWKQGMGLTHLDKNASRALAIQLFPHLQPQLKRVKDDGRAEALLIAVYFASKHK